MSSLQRALPFGPARPTGGGAPIGGRLGRRRREREALRRRQFERIMERLRADASAIAAAFGLRYRALLIERPTARSHYGICYQDGTIKIRLNHAVYMRPLRYSSLVNTVCHELAHLRHFDHGEAFKRFYGEILEWARARRIYRPSGRRPEQAALLWEAEEPCEVSGPGAREWLRAMRERLGPRRAERREGPG